MTRTRKAFLAVIMALALAGGLGGSILQKFSVKQALAQSWGGIQLLTSLTGSEQFVLNYPCTVSCGVITNVVANAARSSALLYQAPTGTPLQTVAVGTASFEQVLATYTIATSVMNTSATNAPGTQIKMYASFSFPNSGTTANKQGRCYFGSNIAQTATGVTQLNGTTPMGAASCELTGYIITNPTGTLEYQVYGNILEAAAGSPVINYQATDATDTVPGPLTLKFAAATGSSATQGTGDITLNEFWVQRIGN